MKGTIIFLALAFTFFAPGICHAQYNFPLVELEKLCGKNSSDFDTYVMEKDYTIQSKTSTQILKIYKSDKKSADGTTNVITRYQVPNAASKIEFSTTDKKYYLDVKSKLASMGFKLLNDEVKTINGAQAQVYHYSNGPFQLSLGTYSTEANWYIVDINGNL